MDTRQLADAGEELLVLFPLPLPLVLVHFLLLVVLIVLLLHSVGCIYWLMSEWSCRQEVVMMIMMKVRLFSRPGAAGGVVPV